MSYGEQRGYERNHPSGQQSGFGNARASTVEHPGENPGTSATLSDPNQHAERANVWSYVPEIEHLIELYWSGERSRFKLITSITQFLSNDEDLSTREKSQSFELYLAEVDAIKTSQQGKGKRKAGPEPGGAEQLAHFIAAERRGHDDGRSSPGYSSSLSESDDEGDRKRRKLRQSDMPWYGRHGAQGTSQNPSCAKSASIIRKFNRDIKSAKLYIKLAPDAPRGIPMSEWEHVFKGEPIDLDKILSSLHRVTIDLERKACIGETEISIGGAEAKRKVETSSEWSTAWRSALRAIAFVFEHRDHELAEYGDYIERLFAAKRTGSHGQVILFDKGVRNEVGGGQTLLLTDYHYFTSLYAATLQDDGIEYHRSGRGRGGGPPTEPKTEVCLRFNGQKGCRFTEAGCKYRHVCQGCGEAGHGKLSCPKGH